jgi:hypothetical protein
VLSSREGAERHLHDATKPVDISDGCLRGEVVVGFDLDPTGRNVVFIPFERLVKC